MEITLSQKFDSVYAITRKLLESDEESFGGSREAKINECVQNLEEITVSVSKLSLFSKNESHEELSGDTLKFMLLPYLLGSLWQIKKVTPPPAGNMNTSAPTAAGQQNVDLKALRKNVCDVSQIYFQDFIQRCLDYNVITVEPAAVKLLREFSEVETQKEDTGSGDTNFAKKQMGIISKYFDSGDRRQAKVQNFKDAKELEHKIKALEERQRSGEELDEETVRSLYLLVLRRAVHDASTQIESIIQELHLLSMTDGGGALSTTNQQNTNTTTENPFGLPFKTFILTKTDIQKNVFGMGYPSLPVMTVEELYEQRRKDGTWPGPPTSGAQQHQPTENAEEEEVDEDDPEYLARQRAMDEFKDTHRRGWGNRMNRS